VIDTVERLLDVEEENRDLEGLAARRPLAANEALHGGEEEVDGVGGGVAGAEPELVRSEVAASLQLED